MPEDYITDTFVFWDSDNKKVIAPCELRKEIRKIIKKLDIPPEIIPVPDNAKGTIETNLSYYPGDLFRSNFSFYARHVGKFESGELEYCLGIQASTTFSKNYCDYSNEFAQIIIYAKLQRMCQILLEEASFQAYKSGDIEADRLSYVTHADDHNRSFLGIDINVPEGSEAEISVETLFGNEISVQKMENKYDN